MWKETVVKNFMQPTPVGSDKFPKYTISAYEEDGMKFISLCKECEDDFEKFLSSSRGIMNDQ